MRNKDTLLALILGLLFVLPFVALEAYYTSGFSFGFPAALFIFMWLQGILFALTATSIIRTLTLKDQNKSNSFVLIFKIIILVSIIYSWVYLVIDQMPCFLGGRGC